MEIHGIAYCTVCATIDRSNFKWVKPSYYRVLLGCWVIYKGLRKICFQLFGGVILGGRVRFCGTLCWWHGDNMWWCKVSVAVYCSRPETGTLRWSTCMDVALKTRGVLWVHTQHTSSVSLRMGVAHILMLTHWETTCSQWPPGRPNCLTTPVYGKQPGVITKHRGS